MRVYSACVHVCARLKDVKALERVHIRHMAQSGEWQASACKAGENIDVQTYEVSTLLWLDYGTPEGSKSEDDIQGAVCSRPTLCMQVNYAQSMYTHTQSFRSLLLVGLLSNS